MATTLETNFRDVVRSTARKEAIVISWNIDASGTDALLLISDSSIALSPTQLSQSGLLSLVEITTSAGVGTTYNKTATFELMNHPYMGFSATEPKLLAEISHNLPVLGSSVFIYAYISDGDPRGTASEWIQPLIFQGLVVNVQYGDTIIVTAQQATTGGLPCPIHRSDDNLYAWDLGAVPPAVAGSPIQIEGNKGKIIPFGIGRFDASALKDWDPVHPFGVQGLYSTAANKHAANYSDICATFPALIGVKHPMMPCVITHEKVVVFAGSVPDVWTGFIACYGSHIDEAPGGLWELDVRSEPPDRSKFDHSFPGSVIDFETTTPIADDYTMRWTHAWTWHKDGLISRGLPFIMDTHKHGETWDFDLFACLGAAEISVMKDTAGTGEPVYAMFFPSRNSDTPAPASSHRQGLLQAVAIPFDRIGTYGGTVTYDTPTGGALPVPLTTNATNPDNMFDGDPDTSTTILSGESVTLQMTPDFAALGELIEVRVVALIDTDNSDHTLFIGNRQTPNYGPHEDLRADYNNSSAGFWTSRYAGNKLLYTECFLSSTLHKFVSMNLTPLKHANNTRSQIVQATDDTAGAQNIYHKTGFQAQWKFLSWGLETGVNLLWVPEVTFWVKGTGKKVTIIETWLECIFKSRMATGVKTLDENVANFTPPKLSDESGIIYDGNGRPIGRYTAPILPNSNIPGQEQPGQYTPLFLTGRGVRDNEAGDFTGTPYEIIDRPDRIAQVVLEHFIPVSILDIEVGSSVFGSFTDAGADMVTDGVDKMALVVNKAGTVQSVMSQIMTQSRGYAYEDLDMNNVRKWKMFVESENLPASRRFTTPSSLLHFTASANDDDGGRGGMVPGTFRVQLTDLDKVVTRVTMHYGEHLPSGGFAYKHVVTPDMCTFAADASDFKTWSGESETEYNISVHNDIYAPDIWNHLAAEDLCKWWFLQRFQSRVTIEFKTFAVGLELRPGHYIAIKNNMDEFHPYPGRADVSSSWEGRKFIVNETIVNQDGPFITVTVRCIEHYDSTPS